MRRFLRFLLRFSVVAGALGLLLVAGFYLYLRQSLPQTKGEIRLAGLGASAEILRDRYGIPHIFAGSVEYRRKDRYNHQGRRRHVSGCDQIQPAQFARTDLLVQKINAATSLSVWARNLNCRCCYCQSAHLLRAATLLLVTIFESLQIHRLVSAPGFLVYT